MPNWRVRGSYANIEFSLLKFNCINNPCDSQAKRECTREIAMKHDFWLDFWLDFSSLHTNNRVFLRQKKSLDGFFSISHDFFSVHVLSCSRSDLNVGFHLMFRAMWKNVFVLSLVAFWIRLGLDHIRFVTFVYFVVGFFVAFYHLHKVKKMQTNPIKWNVRHDKTMQL